MGRKYLIVIEKAADGSYSAYVPDLPGCVSCGDTPAEARLQIQEAIDLHLAGLIADGEPIPEPTAQADYVESSAT